MKKMNKKLTLALAAAAIFALPACENETAAPGPEHNEKGVPLAISAGVQTRAADNAWHAGDAIGIFTVETGTTTVHNNQANFKYTNQADAGTAGTFEPDGTANVAYFPHDGTKLDIMAYYPWRDDADNGQVAVNVALQTSLPAIDLMTSAVAGPHDKNTAQVELKFHHRLAKLVLTISTDATTADIDPATATAVIKGMKTRATYFLETGTLGAETDVLDIAMVGRTAIVIPTAAGAGVQIVVTAADGTEFTGNLPDDLAIEAGKVTTVAFTLHKSGSGVPAATIEATIADWTDGATTGVTATYVLPPSDPEVTEFLLWKNDDEAGGSTYKYENGAWTADPAFFLVADVAATDRFFARHTPADADADPVTGVKDILEASLAEMDAAGVINLEFLHVNAILKIRVYAGDGFLDAAHLGTAEVTYQGFTYTGADKTMIIAPRSFQKDAEIATVVVNNRSYTIAAPEATEFAGGTENILNITLKSQSAAGLAVTTADWAPGSNKGIEATNTVQVVPTTTTGEAIGEFTLYKTDEEGNTQSVTYKLESGVYKPSTGTAPFYIEDIDDGDMFTAEAVLDDDPQTLVYDIVRTPTAVAMTGDGTINLTFKHVNAKLTVVLKGSPYESALADARYSLFGGYFAGTPNTLLVDAFSTPANNVLTDFTITIGTRTFPVTIDPTMTLAGGTHTTLTITLDSETAAGISVTLTDWTAAEEAKTAVSVTVPDMDVATGITEFDLWLAGDYTNRRTYKLAGTPAKWGITNGKADFYLEDLDSDDRFYARATLSAVTGQAPDYLVANAIALNTDNQIPIVFTHAMSKLTLSFKHGTGFEAADMAGAELTVKLKGYSSIDAVNVVTTTVVASDKTITAGSYIYVPQEHTDLAITVTLGGRTYSGTINLKLEAGKETKLELTINATAVTATVSVTDWVEDDNPTTGDLELQ